MCAGLQGWHIVYRLQLFFHDYHGKRYANHVGDGLFAIVHAVNILLLLAGAFSVWALRLETGVTRWTTAGIAVANLAAWLAITYMRATGVLVSYTESIQHWKGQ